MTSKKAINVKDLCFSYEKITVLDYITFSIDKGKFIAVIGPNGGGKTTLLKLLMGLLKPKKGTIHLNNLSPEKMRQSIGYVPQINQTDHAFPITVLELILLGSVEKAKAFGRYPSAVIDKAKELSKKLGLTEFENQSFGSLSGGLMQRTLIARSLMCDPDFLFLDEATASVDVATQESIFAMLEEFKGEKTILMVTHDLEAIFKNVDQVICVNQTITSYLPKDVCGHFTMGLYHPPLKINKNEI